MKFKAMLVSETAEKTFVREVALRSLDMLPAGDLLIEVAYSSLNYKDALSATGHKGVTRNYPHTPGIDAAGTIVQSSNPEFAAGDKVVVTGFDLGMNTSGGFGRYIRVPASWAVRLPESLTLRDSMAYGTAGFTAALAVWKMQQHGLEKGRGEVLVTGATGGVGSLAVSLLARSGFHVVASTGKAAESDFLLSLGAREVISRDAANDTSGKPMLKGRWAGVVDTVGGGILASSVKSANYGGVVAVCGNVASADLPLNVYPFILRGASLLGIDSVNCPMATRLLMWKKIAGEWKLDTSGSLFQECSLSQLDPWIDSILQGGVRGRVIVNLVSD